jgi:heme exporter protein D
MNWDSAADFFAMGGYAFYVWGAYGVAALAVAIELALLAARRRALKNGGAS